MRLQIKANIQPPTRCDYCNKVIPESAIENLKEKVCPDCMGELNSRFSEDDVYGINSEGYEE